MKNEKSVAPIVSVFTLIIYAVVYFLTYGKGIDRYETNEWRFLADLNALLNLTTTMFLVLGLLAIKNGQRNKHQQLMLAALVTSVCFFISYSTYHHLYGDTKFLTQGPMRPIYFVILITHILASGLLVPLLLTALAYIVKGNEIAHKRIARWTWPVWFYVSVTGVLVYVFLKYFNYTS